MNFLKSGHIKLMIIVLISFEINMFVASDPCTSYLLRRDEYKRSSGYTLGASDNAISDNFLQEQWYRFDSGGGNDMVTTAPNIQQCGTIYPIWLRGTLPSQSDGIVNRTACIVGFTTNCDSTIPVRITNCTTYNVYYLKPPQQTITGYCIGTEIRCPAGQGSETGFTPCQVLIDVSVTPRVEVSLENGTEYASGDPSLQAVFKCSFPEPATGPHFYKIDWIINGESVKVVDNVSYGSNRSWLLPEDWVHKHNLNMVVKCSVRVRHFSTSAPGSLNTSPDFQAGVFPSASSYLCNEGETIEIPFNVTVPVGCISSQNHIIRKNCFARIYIHTPEYHPDYAQCGNFENRSSISFEEDQCGLEIKHLDWKEEKILKVTGNVDGMINIGDRDVFIKFDITTSNIGDRTGVWNNITIPDIKVYVSDVDTSVESMLCYARTDPRMRTFDGKTWNAQLAGEFIMYRNIKRNIEVHALFTSCRWNGWRGQGPCGCGIAVRVENSLYVYRTCQQISYQYVNLLAYHSTVYSVCDDRHIVVEPGNPSTTILLPTGTKIKYRVGSDWLYAIDIYPSHFDLNNTDGLCGNPNNNENDDMIPLGSTTPTNDNTLFQQSWRVDLNDGLFIANPSLPAGNNNLQKYCSCAREVANSDYIFSEFNEVNCNITAPVVDCSRHSTEATFTTTCTSRNRKRRDLYAESFSGRYRRSVDDADDVVDVPPLNYTADFDPNFVPPNPDWKNGWNESTAREYCENIISNNHAIKECEKILNVTKNTKAGVEECIYDIRDMGNTEWADVTLEALKSSCLTQIEKYEKFYISNGTESKSVVELFSTMSCKNDCSGKGICINGTCNCNINFIGADCSYAKANPPVNISIPNNGLCQINVRPCVKTNMMGYFQSKHVMVKLESFELTALGMSGITVTTNINAIYRTPTMVSVNIPGTSRRKRSTASFAVGYNISLSYDGITYGDAVPFIIYNENCFACNTSTIGCAKLSSCVDSTSASSSDTTTSWKSSSPETSNLMPTTSDTITSKSLSAETPTVMPVTSASNMNPATHHPKHIPKKKENSNDGSSHSLIIVCVCISAATLCIIVGTIIFIKVKKSSKRSRSVVDMSSENHLRPNFPPTRHILDTKPDRFMSPPPPYSKAKERPMTASSIQASFDENNTKGIIPDLFSMNITPEKY